MTWIFDNTRIPHTVRVGEELLTFAQALSHYGAAPSYLVRRRIGEGWDVEKAFTTPVPKNEGWEHMTTNARVGLIRRLAADGLVPDTMALKIPGVTAKKLAIFCGNHSISYGAKRTRMDERPPEAGLDFHSAAIDPKTQPNPNGVHLLETNSDTCKWPMWQWDAPPEQRLCCGRQTTKGPYCDDHHKHATTWGFAQPDEAAEENMGGSNELA